MPRLYVGGVGGCGKTVACKKVAAKFPGVVSLTGSEIMMRAAGVHTREELEQLPEGTKDWLRATAFEEYYKRYPDLIIEGHFFLTGVDIPYFDEYVLIEAALSDLIRFRLLDPLRKRDIDPENIRQEMQAIEGRVNRLEKEYGIKVVRIKNDSSLEDLAEKIERIFISCLLERQIIGFLSKERRWRRNF